LSTQIKYGSSPLLDFLNIVFLADHDQDIAILDHKISPRDQLNAIRKNIPDGNDLDVILRFGKEFLTL